MRQVVKLVKGGYADKSAYSALLVRYNKCKMLQNEFSFDALNKFAGSILFLPSELGYNYEAIKTTYLGNELVFICYNKSTKSSNTARILLLRDDGLYKVLSFKPSVVGSKSVYFKSYKIFDSSEIFLYNRKYTFSLKYTQGYKEYIK